MIRHERKVPFVAQSQKTECGLACVCMINRYYMNNISMEELRNQLEIGRDGSSFQQLINVLRNNGFDVKSYNIPIDKLKLLKKPAIFFWSNSHFMVLEKVSKYFVTVVDPAIGRYKMTYEELEEGYTGYAITPTPNESFRPNKEKIYSWHYFLPYIFERKTLYIEIIIASLFVYVFTIGMPVIVQNIIDNIVQGNNYKNSNIVFGTIVAISILYFIFNLIKNAKLVKLRAYLDRSLNKNIFSHLLKLPYKFFSVRSSGDIIYSLNTCLNIKELFANQFISSVLDCGAGIVILVYIYSLSKVLGVAACCLLVLNIIIVSSTRSVLIDNSRSITSSQSKVQGIQLETVYSMLGVKMSAIEDDIFTTWNKAFDKYYEKSLFTEKIKNYIQSINAFLQFISPAILLIIGIYLANKSVISIGSIVAIYSLGNTFFGLSSSVLNLWTSFINSSVIFDRLVDIMKCDEESDKFDASETTLNGDIKLENVGFRYTKDSAQILDSISLTIKSGMKVAIVGKSGSGKSTLAKLLVGLYEPTNGNIYFDDIELKKWKKKALRQQVGIVPQDITLFNNSIYDNIVMNRNNIGLEQVKKACELAQISDEIEEMPMQYYTEISELGLNLSGGQRQRIALARAIVGKPKILLLDEATSSLDNINERKVSDEIKKMGATQIIIAHRLSTIMDADLIVVLENGKIVEQGKHDDLIKNNGQYKELYSALV